MTAANPFIESALARFESYKQLAERAITQTADAHLHQPLDEHTNSIVIIMKHLAGNMLSRWTDFLTTDGEKSWRHRDQEFFDDFSSREQLMAYWEKGWDCCFDALQSLSDEDLAKTITIRGESHSVIDAIHRQMVHYGYHVGQIVLLARYFAGDQWETLTIPRGGSDAFNAGMGYEPGKS